MDATSDELPVPELVPGEAELSIAEEPVLPLPSVPVEFAASARGTLVPLEPSAVEPLEVLPGVAVPVLPALPTFVPELPEEVPAPAVDEPVLLGSELRDIPGGHGMAVPDVLGMLGVLGALGVLGELGVWARTVPTAAVSAEAVMNRRSAFVVGFT